MMRFEQALTRAEGLPRRPCFRHHIYASGFYTGYDPRRARGESSEQIAIVAKVLEGSRRRWSGDGDGAVIDRQ
jgi:Transferrin receptor-like dimerisation domain